MDNGTGQSRRGLIGALGAGVVLAAAPVPARAAKAKQEEGISPAEDLMREHGVLERILLVYEAALLSWRGGQPFDAAIIGKAAAIVRRFIEDYHERLEERHLFPLLRQRRGALIDTLLRQHAAGRRLTDQTLALAPRAAGDADVGRRLAAGLAAFSAMYRPHAAREDTELFPLLHKAVAPRALAALGEQFEAEEHRRFGEGGFDAIVAEVAALERAAGINDLDRFTPSA